MESARTYSCPTCGGQVDEQARTCPFCHDPVATVRCANCYHMNVPHAVHCSGCGREVGLEPVGSPGALTCPRCRTRGLETFQGGPGLLFDCGQCGGQFVEHALLKELMERRQVYPESRMHRPPPPYRPEPVRYVPCPQCDQLMTRRNFGGRSGVVVDVCGQHGIWFDLGELPRVLTFVRNGGLARAEARRRTENRPPPSVVALPSMATTRTNVGGTDLLEDLADAGNALLSYVRHALKG